MISHHDVPYADPEPLSELIRECHCVEEECAAHGVALHSPQRWDSSPHPAPVLIGEVTRHILDGYADYGS
jgi:hypothetical protein